MDDLDHRNLGVQLKLWHLQDDAPGMVFWHPRGYAIYRRSWNLRCATGWDDPGSAARCSSTVCCRSVSRRPTSRPTAAVRGR